MNREQLDRRNTAAIQRHLRTIIDQSGRMPQQLLDDLAAIADEHAAEVDPIPALEVPLEVLPPSGLIPVGTERASAPAKPAPRRTTSRRSPK